MTQVLDMTTCFLWILSYTAVLISTIKYKNPGISSISQVAIASFEFAVLIKFICEVKVFDYVFFSYLYWTLIEIGIIVAVLYYGRIRGKDLFFYLTFLFAATALMVYLVKYKGEMFFFGYFNTFVGEMIWFLFILRKNYPMKPINLLSFILKFIGDAIAVPVYFNTGRWFISVFICVGLPILDLCFIITYFAKRNIAKKLEAQRKLNRMKKRPKKKRKH